MRHFNMAFLRWFFAARRKRGELPLSVQRYLREIRSGYASLRDVLGKLPYSQMPRMAARISG
jgi:hypothetical protein